MKGLVTKKIADNFEVAFDNFKGNFTPRGTLKKDGIFVGDFVEVDPNTKTIEKVYERKNLLVRPTFANLSALVIVIAPIPKPDFAVVDKLMLFCHASAIEPILCVNKIDLADELFLQSIKSAYGFAKVFFVSAKNGQNLQQLHEHLKGHISAFAGQSAVGKSALVHAMFPNANVQIGELSKKIERGKHTTRHVELFELEQNTFLANTPGFSRLDEKYLPIDFDQLRYFYPDFLGFHEKCKYKSCTHTKKRTGECGVKSAVEQGKLNKGRYERYVNIFNILKKEQEYA